MSAVIDGMPPRRQPERGAKAPPLVCVGVELPPAVVAEIDERCRREHLTRSYWVARVVAEQLGLAWSKSAIESRLSQRTAGPGASHAS